MLKNLIKYLNIQMFEMYSKTIHTPSYLKITNLAEHGVHI